MDLLDKLIAEAPGVSRGIQKLNLKKFSLPKGSLKKKFIQFGPAVWRAIVKICIYIHI